MPTGVVTVLDMTITKMARGKASESYPRTNLVGRHGISEQFVPIKQAVVRSADGGEDTAFAFSTSKLGKEKAEYDAKRAYDAAKRYVKGLANATVVDTYVTRTNDGLVLVVSGK